MNSLVGSGFLWLRELKLAGNQLEGPWPRGFEALPALISLDLSFNPRLCLGGADLSPLVRQQGQTSDTMYLVFSALGLAPSNDGNQPLLKNDTRRHLSVLITTRTLNPKP